MFTTRLTCCVNTTCMNIEFQKAFTDMYMTCIFLKARVLHLYSYRCDMSKNCHRFSSPTMARRMCPDWHKLPGCHSQPFFNFLLNHVVVDELHLMLRVTDCLEEGLIMGIINWDEVQNM